MTLSLGMALGLGGGGFVIGITASISGLTLGEARPGDHASLTASVSEGTITARAWGSTLGGTQYGTGTSPTNYTAGDGGLLYLRVTVGGETYDTSAPIRYAAGTAPTIGAQTLTVDTDPGTLDASASGANLTFTYAATGLPSGRSINTSTGAITGTPDAVDSGTAAITATDQYSRALNYGYTFTASLPAVGTFTAQPQITGTLQVGQTLTIDEGTFSTTATLTVETFTLDSVDKSSELSGTNWDTTGENVYGAAGQIALRIQAEDAYGRTVLSNTITETLTDVPQAMSAPSVTSGGETSISVDRASAPDDGNSSITSYDLRHSLDESTWTTVTGVADPATVASLTASTLYYAQTRAVNAVGAGAWSASGSATTDASSGDTTAPTATGVSAGAQTVSGVPITITDLDEDSTAYWVLVTNGSTAPDADEVVAGQASGGGAPADSGNFAATIAGGPYTEALVDGLGGSYDLYIVFRDAAGNNSTVYSDTAITIDSDAPTVSGVSGTQTGQTTATWAATSDQAGGTIYAAARVSTDAVLSKTNIENGTGDAVATDTDASPTADGNNGGSFTGLTASATYHVDVFHRDALGNESDVDSSASTFTTDAAGSWAFTVGDGQVTITSAPTAPSAPTIDSVGDGQVTLS